MSSKHATPKLDNWKWKRNSRRSSLRQCQVKYSHFSPRGGGLNPLLHSHHHLHLTVSSVCLRSLIFFPPVLVEQIVDAVKVPLAAENVAIQPPEHSSSGESQAVTAPFVQAIGGVPADLSSRSVMPLDSGVMLSSILSTLSNTGMHSFAVPLFVNTFLPVPLILPLSSATAVVGPLLSSSPFNANSTFLMPSDQLSTNTFSNPLPVLF